MYPGEASLSFIKRDEAHPAREYLRISLVLPEQPGRLLDGGRREVLEASRQHGQEHHGNRPFRINSSECGETVPI